MTTGVTGRGLSAGALLERWLMAVGAATTVVAMAAGIGLQSWAQGPPPRHDLFEPFLDPWSGITWITVLALWIASVTRRWLWLPLTAIGLFFVAIQVWMVVRSAGIGLQDGLVGGPGALAGALSLTQIGLTLAWMVLIALMVRSKRMPS